MQDVWNGSPVDGIREIFYWHGRPNDGLTKESAAHPAGVPSVRLVLR